MQNDQILKVNYRYTSSSCYKDDQIKEDKMKWVCNHKILVRKHELKKPLEHLGMDVRVILQRILQKLAVRAWIWQLTLGSIKSRVCLEDLKNN